MTSKKGWLYVLFLLSSLIFVGFNHRGSIVGDDLFSAIGIPPWSDPVTSQGFHYSTIFGIVMVIISGNLTIKHFRKHYKKYVGRTVLISSIIFIYVYPLLTEQLYYLTHAKKTGIEVVDFLEKDSRCMYDTVEDIVSIQCTLRIANYGGHDENVKIRPIFQQYGDSQSMWSFIEVRHHDITLTPRSIGIYSIRFESEPDDRIAELGASGNTNSLGLEFVKDDQVKKIPL
ncbi:hypothetical protein [Paenibacillus sp. Marseille-Q4541]|uniref:hypothetical protein n=1 Tax=Paenibacillus sp. Marseille-Q4541 TaxID=2831522 RepID=UPI001BA4DD2C|nr:hypothetical protein [Paenibacillus sp. Marseille-Q4541]